MRQAQWLLVAAAGMMFATAILMFVGFITLVSIAMCTSIGLMLCSLVAMAFSNGGIER